MRRAARTDANHAEIVRVLTKIGVSVADTSRVGSGFPDLVVGFRGKNLLLEVKDGRKSPSRRKLTAGQQEFAAAWRGQVRTVESVAEALSAVLTM